MNGGFRVEPGSAARDAEQRARESGATPFRGNMGIRVSAPVGRKFAPEPPRPQPEAPAPAAAAPAKKEEAAPSAAARVWAKFLGLFFHR